ncbi:hypothetical protein JCM6882_008928 [Rhodosporidiobolus microsporus]
MPQQPPPPQRRRSSQVLATDYHLDVRQQPRQARMAGAGEKADRRPIDPPPIIRLRVRKPHARRVPAAQLADSDLLTPTLTHTLFMFASLVPENSEEEMYDLTGSKSKLVAGSVVSSLFHLKDQSCFVFPDLSVRTEGRWRFKMSLFELGEDGVHFCTDILTDVFQVYSSKRFPGMGKSTELSKAFAQQGLKLRIRRPGSKADDDADEPPPRQPKGKGNNLRHPPNAAPPPDHVAAPSRRPSAPVASSSEPYPPSRKRPWTSYDSGPAYPGGHPHAHAHSHSHAPAHPHAYAPYPSRLSHSASARALAPPHNPLDGRRAASYSHAYPPPSVGREEALRERYYTSPPTDSAAVFPPSHAQAYARDPRLPPPTAGAYPYHPATSASSSSASSLAAHSLTHSRSHATLSPPNTSSGSSSSFSRHFPPPSALPPSLSHSHSHPILAPPVARAHAHPHAHAPPARSPSPPPILAPIRTFPRPPSFPPPSTAATPVSPPALARTPAVPEPEPGYDAATVAAGAALASLFSGGGGAGGRPRRATESSVRSTGSEEEGQAPAREETGGKEVEMKDAEQGGEGKSPVQSRGSLAMLLGGGGGPGGGGAGEGGEGGKRDESGTVDFF